ncbi:LytR C-terminal domain-containing protein, partial [Escherichia coli]|nr:LytR C-terminal domain-containing protein [Escherichia coli]
ARIELSNGNGAEGFAAKVRAWLAWLGVKVDRLTNQRPYRQGITVVQYRDGYEAQGRELARSLPLPAELEVRDDLDPHA